VPIRSLTADGGRNVGLAEFLVAQRGSSGWARLIGGSLRKDMRSQVRFFMDADDERRFVDAIVEDPHTFLVNGPHWQSSAVPVVEPQNLASAESYLMIWNKAEIPRLRARKADGYWEAYNDRATIQFLRCELWDESILTEGRIAIATDDAAIERRYKRLRRQIHQTFRNEIVCWFHPGAPRTAKNPSEPDHSVWVGPGALAWLRGKDRRKFKQERTAPTEAIVCADYAR
jgi:hypothetical protein